MHLHLNPEHVEPRFMVHWFNTSQVGQATLAMVTFGNSMPRIDPSALLAATIYLPPVPVQIQTIDGMAHLTRIRAVADELETALWDGNGDIDAVLNGIATINREDRFEDWLETLPFPLASILWRHHAGGGSTRERYEILLHFFEATAAFLATLHLSAFMASDALWNEHCRRLTRVLADQKLSIDRATFGVWRLVTEYLSSECGRLSQKEDHLEIVRTIYATPDKKVLAMLSSAELRTVLQRANSIRNDWSGHTGAIGENQAQQILNELMDLTQRVRGVFGRTWLNYALIQPGASRYTGGMHYYKAKRLMGTRSAPFEEVELDSTYDLDSEALYVFDTNSKMGLKLQPFVRVMPSPKKRANTCFIFNRREAEGFRFVSYHFEDESEMTEAFPEVGVALERLRLIDGESSA